MSQKDSTKFVEFYGFAMTDFGHNFNQINPEYYDAMRPTRLPAYENEFGADGNTYFSARQTRFGVQSEMETKFGKLYTVFDFDLFGVGPDAGQTTMRVRHAYGQLGHFGAGQTESAFMDLSVFPNSLEYWGPSGMLFFRNVQFRWIPIIGPTELVFALELPGASADRGIYSDHIQLDGVTGHFPLPDLSGHYRYANEKFGYIQLGAMLRRIQWEDQGGDSIDISGGATGYGISLSAGINVGEMILIHLQGIYGAGVENYFNDAPVDVGIENHPDDADKPLVGVALPNVGLSGFVDLKWSDKFTSSVGYSTTIISNSDGQAPEAFHRGQYAIANLLYYPVDKVMVGVEFQWINRENNSDGFTSSATKINFSLKYSFAKKLYANKTVQ